ncbi:redox-regulated ATPase YchF [Maritalea porphyrae]|uniref:Ribosome-binding ATPase YchF n=1 Tax=Maritalea porphyrae TaxID=880732 RepID=A0ABQ5ULN3_9HYPH|nr:redox-regulated ATPase YchF [Maritalea porphyrae]GLQ16032.1 ribosome-binding ATPase YchF [Maritalea porphyrae]
MGFKCGIVGLPNVGKSTLFNALTRTAAAQAANFPFCTIEPNVGEVSVPDERLDKIAAIGKSAEIIPTRLSFVDIAGLVKGAAQGEGLGNQFLANIREVDAIAYVLRCFENDDIVHVSNKIDPIADAEVVETELMLADMESLEKRIGGLEKRLRGQDKEAKITLELVQRALAVLQDGKPARNVEIADDEKKAFKELNLLTSKPALYICNVDEDSAADGNEMTKRVAEYAAEQNARSVIISAEIESELSQLEDDEQKEFLETLGLEEPGLNRIIREGYKLLNLQTYFTVGPKEARAWTVPVGTKAPQAAGVIHTDFERGFIRAQTIAYDDFVELGGEAAAKEAGKARDEGKEYVVKDGDIMLFKFNT